MMKMMLYFMSQEPSNMSAAFFREASRNWDLAALMYLSLEEHAVSLPIRKEPFDQAKINFDAFISATNEMDEFYFTQD